MKFSVAAATLISLVPAVLGLTIATPASPVQCQPLLLTWQEGTPPYFLSVIPAGQVSAPPLMSFSTQSGTQLTWTVNLASGTACNIAVKDSTGAVAYTDIITIQPGTDSSCLGGSSGIVSSTGAGTPTSTGGSGNSSPASGGSGTSSRSSSTSSPSSGSNTGDASGLAVSSFGIAGVVGVVAALF